MFDRLTFRFIITRLLPLVFVVSSCSKSDKPEPVHKIIYPTTTTPMTGDAAKPVMSREEALKDQLASDDRENFQEMRQKELDRLRALPYLDFAKDTGDGKETGVVYRDPDQSQPGVNFYTIHPLCAAELMDADGKRIRFWQSLPGKHWGNAHLLANGDLMAIGADAWAENEGFDTAFADEKRFILRMNWKGDILWKRYINAHHDVREAPSGRFVTLTFARRLIPAIDPKIETRDDQITLLDSEGNELESLSLYDALAARPDLYKFQAVASQKFGGKDVIDLFHGNSVEWMTSEELAKRDPIYSLDNVLVSSRNQDSIFIINWKSKQVVWAWGQGIVQAQHDAQVLSSGNIIMFDNGPERGFSRAIEINPSTREIVWEYKPDDPKFLHSLSRGSVQRLANGNTLIGDSDHGRAIEVTPGGEIVWEFICPHKNVAGTNRASIVRMRRMDKPPISE